MNALELWKHKQWLSVDEFMCLLFELKPGSVKFDYGKPEEWPEHADIIYQLLFADVMAGKLHVHFQDPHRDPRQNEYFGDEYLQPGNPWWEEGKIHQRELVKWLAEQKIPSDFFGVAQPPTANAKPESSAEAKEQIPAQDTVKEGTPMKADAAANSQLLINFEEVINADPGKLSPQLVANNYLLIGILLEFIIGDLKDLNPKTQAELADLIVEKYYNDGIKGVSKRNIDKKFSIANMLKQMLDKAKKQHDETLKDALG